MLQENSKGAQYLHFGDILGANLRFRSPTGIRLNATRITDSSGPPSLPAGSVTCERGWSCRLYQSGQHCSWHRGMRMCEGNKFGWAWKRNETGVSQTPDTIWLLR